MKVNFCNFFFCLISVSSLYELSKLNIKDILKGVYPEQVAQMVNTSHFQFEDCELESLRK